MTRLLASLGPWAGETAPRGADRSTRELGGVRVHVYRPARSASGSGALGVYLLAPGLHYLGPDDPRCDRFCRALAAAGLVVYAPFLRDYLALRISPRATDDLAVAWDAAEEEARDAQLGKPAIFSISFGSQPALALAARAEVRDRVGAVVLFGGFADFDAAVRFAVTGHAEQAGRKLDVPFDPLNAPVVFLHLLPHLDAADPDALAAAWRKLVERTWGRPEMKELGARDPIAHEIARTLAPADRELFLVGAGLADGGPARVEAGLLRARDELAFADPRPHLAALRAPVAIVHGKDDDVIPWFEAEKIRDALPAGHRHRLHVTGLYGHTGAASPRLSALAREGATMVGLLRTLVDAPTGRL